MTEEHKEKAEEKAPIAEKIADIALKVVMTGGVAGGGLGAFWSLFKESDMPKAIASVVIGLGISYGASLLDPLHKGNKRRLGNAGEAIDKKLEQGLQYIGGKVTGGTPEERYLECQKLFCQAVRSEGLAQHDGIFESMLEDVFVPLSLALASGGSLPGFRSLPIHDLSAVLERNESGIWEFLAQATKVPSFRQLVILAWGGYGKTTLLKHIAYIYGSQQQGRYKVSKKIPMLLILRQHRDLLAQESPPSLPEVIVKHHAPQLPGAVDLVLTTDWAKAKLKAGEMVVLFDGFDELKKTQRSQVARWMNQQMQQYPKSIFIVTSRPKAYKEQAMGDRLELATPLWVENFNAQQRKDFVHKWYLCQERYRHGGRSTPDVIQLAEQKETQLLTQIEARQELKDLAKNPLLLTMIVTFQRRLPNADLPKQRVKLYQEICKLQLEDRPNDRKLETLLMDCDAQTILQMLALEMMQQHIERMDQEILLKQLSTYLQRQRETVKAKDFLEQVGEISELLVKREDEYEFAHLSFQEYLAAVQIDKQKQEALLYEHFLDDWWKQTILLYASLTKNPTTLIKETMQQGAIDLAYACLQMTTKQIDSTLKADVERELAGLKQAVTDSRYAKLEEQLKNQQWREADQETYRLMITTVGKEVGQYFEKEELLNFPCEELRAIDGLWVKHSNGHFGFSVQKRIYVKCGAKLDGKNPGEKIWDTFGDRVGWREKDKWIYRYDDLIKEISLSAHQGKFPLKCCFLVVGRECGWFSLFSLTETCKL